MLLIGSRALVAHGYTLPRAVEDSDYDVICYNFEFVAAVKALLADGYSTVELGNKEHSMGSTRFFIGVKDGKRIILEASIVEPSKPAPAFGTDTWLYTYMDDTEYYSTPFATVALLPAEYALAMKLSHRYKKDTPWFEKTRGDIVYLRQQITLSETHKEFAEAREKLTLQSQTKYKLDTNKSKFFTDNVPYVYDHDSLHVAVKLLHKPAYQYYMQDGAEVMCSREKFFAQPLHVQLLGVFEEACVLALERAIIPHGTDPDKAFKIALEKVCTSITSGWFREFAWENYPVIKAMFDAEFLMQRYTNGLADGTIKLHKQ